MQKKLCSLFTKLAYVYQYKQKKDSEEAKRLAYVAIRNVFGAILFFVLLLIYAIIDLFIFSFSSYIESSPRLYAYPVVIVFILFYLLVSNKILKPWLIMLENIEISTGKLKTYNRMYIGLIVFISFYGGLMFFITRMLYIHFR